MLPVVVPQARDRVEVVVVVVAAAAAVDAAGRVAEVTRDEAGGVSRAESGCDINKK